MDSVSPCSWTSSLLSGCLRGGLNPPVGDQSLNLEPLVGGMGTWLADQNQPLMFLGNKSGRSQPSKSQRRPEVHTALPAVVPGVEPAPLGVLGAEVRVEPAEVIVVTTKAVDSSLVHPVLAELSVRKAQLAGTLVGIPTTISREELVLSGGLRGLCSVIGEFWLLSGCRVAVVVHSKHVDYSLHKGLHHVIVEWLESILDWLEEIPEPAKPSKIHKLWHCFHI